MQECPVPVPDGYVLVERGTVGIRPDLWCTRDGVWVSWNLRLGTYSWDYQPGDHPQGPFFAIKAATPAKQEQAMVPPQPLTKTQIESIDRNRPTTKEQIKEPTMKYWQPKYSKWQREYRTLADVPEGIRCVVTCTVNLKGVGGHQLVLIRSGRFTAYTTGTTCKHSPDNCKVIQILDPIPETPVTLASIPDGRCFTAQFHSGVLWKINKRVFHTNVSQTTSVITNLVPELLVEPIDIEMVLADFPTN